MRFLEQDIKLAINGIPFKAYLEESEIIYEPKSQQIPFVPTSFVNDNVAIRILEKVKLSFNVFSEYRKECINNYNSLKNLIESMKPLYSDYSDLLVPDRANLTGLINIRFTGFLDSKDVKIHLNNFSWSIMKEMGYLVIPKSELEKGGNPDWANQLIDKKGNDILMPIAFKISIDGNILKKFEKTARVRGKGGTARSKVYSVDEIYAKSGVNDKDIALFKRLLYSATGNLLDQLSPDAQEIVINTFKKNRALFDNNGNATNPEQFDLMFAKLGEAIKPIDDGGAVSTQDED